MEFPAQLHSQGRAPVVGLAGKVLAHVGNTELAARFAGLADGVVLRGSAGARTARRLSGSMFVVLDPERYVPDRRRDQQLELFTERPQDAVADQLAFGSSVLLAPSRFPLDRSPDSIRSLLAAGAEFVAEARSVAPRTPVFVPVVIRFDELADGRWVEPIRASGLPIATIFAAYHDPLADPRQLEGALRVIDAADCTFVLRCDLSVAGFLASGALAGAIGTSSAQRHLWLPRRPSKDPKEPSPSVFVPGVANWMKLAFVAQAEGADDLDEIFRCECSVCGPNGDVRRFALPDVDDDTRDTHSLASAVGLTRRIITADDPVAAWRALCRSALAAYDWLDQLGISGPSGSGALSAWVQVRG